MEAWLSGCLTLLWKSSRISIASDYPVQPVSPNFAKSCIQYNFGDRLKQIELYTFGAPKTGNRGFRSSFNTRVPNSYRFVNGLDIVPALPRPWQRYTHIDQEYRLGSRLSWRFLSKRFTDHDIKNYIQALQALQ